LEIVDGNQQDELSWNTLPPVEKAAKCCNSSMHLEVDSECGDFLVEHYQFLVEHSQAKFRVAHNQLRMNETHE
jgi:hypothetical protein